MPFRPAASPTRARLPWPTEDSPSGLWRSPGTRVGLIALAGSNPASSAVGCGAHGRRRPAYASIDERLQTAPEEGYGPHCRGGLARAVVRRCRLLVLLFRPASL